MHFVHVQHFAHGAIGPREVEMNFALEAYQLTNQLGQFPDGHVAASAHVHGAALVVVLHQKQAGLSQVVDVQKLAAGRAGAPHFHAGQLELHGLHKLAQQGGHHVGVFQVVVVVGAVEVGRHHGDEVAAVLVAVGFAHLHARDFGNGVRLVGRLQRAGHDVLFPDGLRGQLGVDARRAQVQQLAHPVPVALVEHVALNHEVVVEKIGPVGIVGVNAAHFGGRQQHVVRLLVGKKPRHRGLVAQVQLGRSARYQVGVARAAQQPHKSRANHAAVPGNVYFGVLFHEWETINNQISKKSGGRGSGRYSSW